MSSQHSPCTKLVRYLAFSLSSAQKSQAFSRSKKYLRRLWISLALFAATMLVSARFKRAL